MKLAILMRNILPILRMLISDIVLSCMDIEICFVRLREYCMLEAEQVDRDIIYLKFDILQETICI